MDSLKETNNRALIFSHGFLFGCSSVVEKHIETGFIAFGGAASRKIRYAMDCTVYELSGPASLSCMGVAAY